MERFDLPAWARRQRIQPLSAISVSWLLSEFSQLSPKYTDFAIFFLDTLFCFLGNLLIRGNKKRKERRPALSDVKHPHLLPTHETSLIKTAKGKMQSNIKPCNQIQTELKRYPYMPLFSNILYALVQQFHKKKEILFNYTINRI